MLQRLIGICLICAPCGWCWAATPIDYARDVKPIFERRCFACHGALKQESGLRLDTARSILAGGESGPAVIRSDPAASVLVQRITSKDEAERMPPEGARLSADEIRAISDWIATGAESPADESPQEDPRAHWAFRKPVRSGVPHVSSEVSSNPIDAFIAKELRSHGLEPLPEADKPVLLRRVYLDLVGLPPTPDELRAFLADCVARRLRESRRPIAAAVRPTASVGAGTGWTCGATAIGTAGGRCRT